MASVSLRKVGKSYSNIHISKDINLDIHEGEFVVFVGPSGCGKSTLLRMIAGLEDIYTGELYIGDKLMNDVPPAKRGISMIFPILCFISAYRGVASVFWLKTCRCE